MRTGRRRGFRSEAAEAPGGRLGVVPCRDGRTHPVQVTSVTHAPTCPRRHSARCDTVLTGARPVWHHAESRHPARLVTVRTAAENPQAGDHLELTVAAPGSFIRSGQC
jgi:hypothetical protein